MSLEKPRFRRDLEARPVTTDGQSYVEVWDAAAGKSFLFYDFEYQVALAFDGLPLEKVIPWVKLATGLVLQVDQLREFVQRLDELGFLEHEVVDEIRTEIAEKLAETIPPLAEAVPARIAEEAPQAPVPLPAPGPEGKSDQEQRVQNAESSAEVAPELQSREPATPAEQPASKADGAAESDEPPPEETPGPPPPDAVVMRPGEVVGETPPPVAVPIVSESERELLFSTGQQVTTETAPEPIPPEAPPPEPSVDARPETAGSGELSETAAPAPPELAAESAAETVDAAAVPANEPAPVAIAETAPAAGESSSEPTHPEEGVGVLGDESETIAEALHPKEPPPEPSPKEAIDSTAFPVLPVNRSAPSEAAPPSAPQAWTTPRPLTTPRPVTLGPLVDRPSVRRRTRRSLALFGTLGVLAAAALLAVVLPFVFSARKTPLVQVRTQTITLGTVYRYFEGAAPIVAVPGPVLKFPAGGKVSRMVAKGTVIAPGDVVAAVEAARGLQTQLVHQRERLAYYQQMSEAMHQVGNSKEEERQLATVEVRKAAIAKTLRELAAVAVIAGTPGEVEEVLAHEGDAVDKDSPAVRLRSPGFRATLELVRAQASAARRLGFCQVEVEGYLLDCTLAPPTGDETHVAVDLASVPPALVGKPAHLARARYSSATVLPLAALQSSGSHVGVFVVPASARLEMRPVAVADRDDVEAIVVQGLDGGDKVVVEPASGLRAGMPVGSVSRK